MKRIFLLGLLGLMFTVAVTPSWATVAWRNGTGSNTVLGTENVSDVDSASYNNIVAPLDSLLSGYREGISLAYASAATLTATAGQITVSNTGGTTRLMLSNSSATTLTWADIDALAEATSTTYYVYAIAASASSTEATFKISTNSTTPATGTYYKKLGSFYNNSDGDMSLIDNVNDYELGSWSAKSDAVVYTATTDGLITASRGGGAINVNITVEGILACSQYAPAGATVSCFSGVRQGSKWNTDNADNVYFLPINK